MSQTVASVHEIESVDKLLHLLKYTKHNGFPVINKDTKRLEGLILRSQIIVMLHRRAFCGRNGALLSEVSLSSPHPNSPAPTPHPIIQ